MEGKVYFYLSHCYSYLKVKERGAFKMVVKKSKFAPFNLQYGISEVFSRDIFTHRKHVPRSVCDTERDRRQHKDPLKEEELQ
jgi:hypothetical protein